MIAFLQTTIYRSHYAHYRHIYLHRFHRLCEITIDSLRRLVNDFRFSLSLSLEDRVQSII